MTSKETERKALEQIRKIVEGLGEDSYIGMAFDGCFEIAQENIDNDWGCSLKGKWELSEARLEHYKHIVDQKNAEIKDLKLAVGNMPQKLADANDCLDRMRLANIQNLKSLEKAEKTVEEKDAEIVKLKAKLYDMMMEKVGE